MGLYIFCFGSLVFTLRGRRVELFFSFDGKVFLFLVKGCGYKCLLGLEFFSWDIVMEGVSFCFFMAVLRRGFVGFVEGFMFYCRGGVFFLGCFVCLVEVGGGYLLMAWVYRGFCFCFWGVFILSCFCLVIITWKGFGVDDVVSHRYVLGIGVVERIRFIVNF